MITIDAKEVNFYYGDFHALKNITMEMERNTVTAFIGPSGCGKSTFLRLLNRMNDLIPGTRLTGEILIDGENIYARQWSNCAKRWAWCSRNPILFRNRSSRT